MLKYTLFLSTEILLKVVNKERNEYIVHSKTFIGDILEKRRILMQWRNQSHRPKPVTVISILQMIGCIGWLIFGVLLTLQIIQAVTYSADSEYEYERNIGYSPTYLASYALIAVFFALAVLFVIAGRGLYVGKGWSWRYIVILQAIGIPMNLVLPFLYGNSPGAETFLLGAIPGIIVNIITLSYMLRPRTRAYFGKIVI